MRYYARISPLLLPVIDDRPLVMKRLPNGVDRHGVLPASRARAACRRACASRRCPTTTCRRGSIGGIAEDAALHGAARVDLDGPVVLAGAIAATADQVAIDLDPQPGATFTQILDVARWVRDELERVRRARLPEDLGLRGPAHLHPAAAGHAVRGRACCSVRSSRRWSRRKHPKVATVERMVERRKDGTVYVDYLQNIQGKTLACAYSARASAFAGVSTPLTWDEVDEGSLAAGLHDRDHRPRACGRSATCGRTSGRALPQISRRH